MTKLKYQEGQRLKYCGKNKDWYGDVVLVRESFRKAPKGCQYCIQSLINKGRMLVAEESLTPMSFREWADSFNKYMAIDSREGQFTASINAPDTTPNKATKTLKAVDVTKDLDDLTAAERKQVPIATGALDYFPDALAAVAAVSFVGNEQHNPGTPLHWDRDKSQDEADACMRHFVKRGTIDKDGGRHSAKAAWRILALLQKEIEQARQEQKQNG